MGTRSGGSSKTASGTSLELREKVKNFSDFYSKLWHGIFELISLIHFDFIFFPDPLRKPSSNLEFGLECADLVSRRRCALVGALSYRGGLTLPKLMPSDSFLGDRPLSNPLYFEEDSVKV